MPKKDETITARIPASLKHTIDKIPEDNSAWIRNVLQREADRREMMRDERKKGSPAKIERVKELTNEISSLEEEHEKHQARLEEIRKAAKELEEQIAKKRSLKENIMSEIERETDMDELMIKQLAGDIQ